MENPSVIRGELVPSDQTITASSIMDPISMRMHRFGNLLRQMVRQSPGIFRTETEQDDAIKVINEFEMHFIPPRDRQFVVSPTDVAPKEDVSQRRAPLGTPPPIPQATENIDYAKLAQALIYAQQQREASYEPAGDDGADGTTGDERPAPSGGEPADAADGSA